MTAFDPKKIAQLDSYDDFADSILTEDEKQQAEHEAIAMARYLEELRITDQETGKD